MKKILIICALAIAPALYAQTDVQVVFHNFPWGTSLQEFTAKMGNPVHTEEIDGLRSLIYDNIFVSGYPVFMLVYFSQNGLEGGTYYFNTSSFEELMKCYTDVQKELLAKLGPTNLANPMMRERFPYVTSWTFSSGYVHLRVDTRRDEPVTLWYSSPGLTEKLKGS